MQRRRAVPKLSKKDKSTSSQVRGERLTPGDIDAAMSSLVDVPSGDAAMIAAPSAVPTRERAEDPEAEAPRAGSIEALQVELADVRKGLAALDKEITPDLSFDKLKQLKFRKELLTDREGSIRRDLNTFHKAALNGMGATRGVRLIREDFTGIGPQRVEGVLS